MGRDGRYLQVRDRARAKAEADEANLSKTRFLAAAGHDILQPLNAARLYVSSLVERDVPTETRVGGPIDRPHSAAADQRPNGVATDPGPGLHWDRDLTADELAASLTRVTDGVAVSATTR